MWKQCLAEAFGTFVMMFIGTGAIVFSGLSTADPVGAVGVGLAFGASVAAMVYVIGQKSGGHINPAVTIGFFVADRFPKRYVWPHIGSQCAGAFAASLLIALVAFSSADVLALARAQSFGASSWTTGLAIPWWAAALVEFVGTFLFVTIFLVIRHSQNRTALDGLIIGIVMAGLHIALGPLTGPSLNPARALAPALFAGWRQILELSIYIPVPILGGVAAGYASRAYLPTADGDN